MAAELASSLSTRRRRSLLLRWKVIADCLFERVGAGISRKDQIGGRRAGRIQV
jgi:hypothetical protein